MRPNISNSAPANDICTPSGGIFPTALLNRCETYVGLAYDPKNEPVQSEQCNIPPSHLGGASRQATMKLYTTHNVL
jgi:hypothetical protein